MSAPSRWVLRHADVTKVIASAGAKIFNSADEQLQDSRYHASRSHAGVKESAPGYIQ